MKQTRVIEQNTISFFDVPLCVLKICPQFRRASVKVCCTTVALCIKNIFTAGGYLISWSFEGLFKV